MFSPDSRYCIIILQIRTMTVPCCRRYVGLVFSLIEKRYMADGFSFGIAGTEGP
jgi:hypothetical protein